MSKYISKVSVLATIFTMLLVSCAGMPPAGDTVLEPNPSSIIKQVRVAFVIGLVASEPDLAEMEKLEKIFMQAESGLQRIINENGNVRVDVLNELADQLIILADMEPMYKLILLEIKDIVIEAVLPLPDRDFVIEGHTLVYLQQAVEAAVLGIHRVIIAYEDGNA